MGVPEPQFASQARGNGYEGRWRWWYSAIADWMIRNPGGDLKDCAVELGRHVNTVSLIVNTDLFKEYLRRRKEEYSADHDFAIRSRLTEVAEASLDIVLEKLKTKGDQIPMHTLVPLVEGALDRLGYAPKTGPSVAVNVQQNDNRTQVAIGVTPAALEEARQALRLAEQKRAEAPELLIGETKAEPHVLTGVGVEDVEGLDGGSSAPAPLDS